METHLDSVGLLLIWWQKNGVCDCAPGTQVVAMPSNSCGSYDGRPLSSAMGERVERATASIYV